MTTYRFDLTSEIKGEKGKARKWILFIDQIPLKERMTLKEVLKCIKTHVEKGENHV